MEVKDHDEFQIILAVSTVRYPFSPMSIMEILCINIAAKDKNRKHCGLAWVLDGDIVKHEKESA